LFFFLSSSFSGLFGTNVKDPSPKRSIPSTTTTHLSSSTATAVKHSPTNDQVAPNITTDERFNISFSNE
jgi:hypothetical protein